MAEPAAAVRRLRWGLGVASVALAPTALRIALLADRGVTLRLQDARGLVSDAAVSGLLLAGLLSARGRARAAAFIVLPLWALIHAANYETVLALGSMASALDLGYLTDSTFFLGSVLAPSRPLILGALLLGSCALAWKGLAPDVRLRAHTPGIVAAVLVGTHWLWPWADDIAVWRQTNFLQHNVRSAALSLASGSTALSQFDDAAGSMLDLVPSLAADLSGERIVPADDSRPNVLLVILEGVSAAHIESLAADHERRAFVAMPELDAIARANLSFSTFLTHQRRTNRGLYALLCGELPNLRPGLPKMSDYVEGGRVCLPELMRRGGYATAFLQAAPLAFMLKDQFMPRIGFERVEGGKAFQHAYARNKWGVDDRAFFEQALERVDELESQERPWFMTLLTVGTHHPYLFPQTFWPEGRPQAARALAYLDVAIGELQRALEERGILENTLVLFTSDESLGISGTKDYIANVLSQNWGFLIAELPHQKRALIRTPFAQMDLAISVLDQVGLAASGGHLFGRSVFRRYEGPRHLFFANTNQLLVGALDPYARLLLCRKDLDQCRKYRHSQGRVFGPQLSREPWDSELDDVVNQIAVRSVRAHTFATSRRDFQLLADPVFVAAKKNEELIHGGQYIDLERGEWIEVELMVAARGASGVTDFRHTLREYVIGHRTNTHRMVYTSDPISLRAGQRLHLRYTYAPEEEVPGVQCRSYARLKSGDSLELEFETARMSLHRSGEPPETGLSIEVFEVETGGDG